MRSTLFCAAIGLALAGCGLGSVGGGDDDFGYEPDPVPENALCEAQLTLTGSFTPPGTPPGAELGCVPEGTWTINVAIGDNDCGDVPMAGTYVYTVTGTGRDQVITYSTPGAQDLALSIHAGGNGECEGSFEHIWPADGGEFHVALLKPYFDPGTTTMQGRGTYQLWTEHP